MKHPTKSHPQKNNNADRGAKHLVELLRGSVLAPKITAAEVRLLREKKKTVVFVLLGTTMVNIGELVFEFDVGV